MPHDLPPWAAIYQQTQRWIKSGVFEAIVDDLRQLLRRHLQNSIVCGKRTS
jgi:transposase